MKAAYHCAKEGIELETVFIHGGIFIDNARSLLVKRFLKTDCTHLFFIDADLGFESDALAGLILADNPISVGVYPKRDMDKTMFNCTVHEPQEYRDGWLRLDRAATGFMCIRRDVLVEMSKDAWKCDLGQGGITPMVFYTQHGNTFVGEDYSFCADYDAHFMGVFKEPIWAFTDITFDHDGHLGNLHETLLANND